jgi:hypothetical protein
MGCLRLEFLEHCELEILITDLDGLLVHRPYFRCRIWAIVITAVVAKGKKKPGRTGLKSARQ